MRDRPAHTERQAGGAVRGGTATGSKKTGGLAWRLPPGRTREPRDGIMGFAMTAPNSTRPAPCPHSRQSVSIVRRLLACALGAIGVLCAGQGVAKEPRYHVDIAPLADGL